MSISRSLVWAGILILLTIAAGLGIAGFVNTSPSVERFKTDDGIELKFRTAGDVLEQYKDGDWQPFFVKGVNLGATIPGHDPGELAITKKQYSLWFGEITEMGANTIRVYTILPPYFYEALVQFNRKHRETPLYLLQGIWSPEEKLNELKDAYAPEIDDLFKAEITQAVGAVYGDIKIRKTPGKASGTYKADAGPYLIGWQIGTEWDPVVVQKTNDKHASIASYSGKHFSAKLEASPFESWLAVLLDHLAGEESKHGWQHPLAFTDWVTTDPLTHPGEVLINEDLVAVDPMNVTATAWSAGYFASYHVYPYYPDFFRLDKALNDVTDRDGNPDPYRSYLRKLKKHHSGIPIMVTEFGVPSSIGLAHLGPNGRDQGGHTEQEQGNIDAALFQTIVEEKYAGAVLFSWQDEWFKRTWNTMPFELPADRRSMWLNVLTNEQMFGLVGMYPSKEEVITIEGDASDWRRLKQEKEKFKLQLPFPGLKEAWATHDEAYLYLYAELDHKFDPQRELLHFGFDTLSGGNRHGTELGGIMLDEGLETMLTIGKEEESEIKIASNYDFHTRLYGKKYAMINYPEAEQKNDSGVFRPWKLAVGLAMEPPDSKAVRAFEEVTVGRLKRGTNNISSPQYDSHAEWETSGTAVEMRIPWMLLGFSDPSSKQVLSYEDTGRAFQITESRGIRILPWLTDRVSGAANLKTAAITGSKSSAFALSSLQPYTWEGWNAPGYVQRLKPSYKRIKQAFHAAP